MTPRTERQFEQMREDSRDRILDAALPLFAEHGYAATSVRRIAERAAVSQGLLYNYYDGKDAVLRAIFERSMADVSASFTAARVAAGAAAETAPAGGIPSADGMASAAQPARNPGADPADARAALGALVRSAFTIVAEHRTFWQLSYQLRMQPAVQASLGDGMLAWSAAIRAELEQLLRAAGVAGAEDGAVEARVLFAAIDGAAQHYVLDPEAYPVDAVAAAITRRFVSQVKEEAGHAE